MMAKNLIVGFGKTGLSLAQYFIKKNISFDVFEENISCENLSFVKEDYPIFHHIEEVLLENYDAIYLSPGINPHTERFAKVQHKLSNDLNVFINNVKKPYVAITGSNGKSTLVHLLEYALREAGYKAIAIGNNGVPFLDHVEDDVDYFVLEVSSYQLELVHPFVCEVAYVSNISQDHLDRHGTIENYASIKAKLYQNCHYAVINQDDIFCRQMKTTAEKTLTISLADKAQLPPLKMIGQHNQHNALAVLAICSLLKIDESRIIQAVQHFPGLEHRCERVLEKDGVVWWNDSKGTNVESTLVAIQSVSEMTSGKLILILGGQGKAQDFSPLTSLVGDQVRVLILLGECKEELHRLFFALQPLLKILVVETLQEAVMVSKQNALVGDAVLLSPACASLDMFKNYEDRGRQFKNLVHLLS